MSATIEQIAEGLRKLSRGPKVGIPTIVSGKVKSVAGDTATVEYDGLDIPDVHLMTLESGAGKSLKIIPEDGSMVVMLRKDREAYQIIAVDKAKQIMLQVGDMFIDIETIIKLNGDSFGGLVKSEAVAEAINAVQDKVNTIIQILSTTIIPLAPTGTYPFGPLYASVSPMTPVQKQKFENENVKHG